MSGFEFPREIDSSSEAGSSSYGDVVRSIESPDTVIEHKLFVAVSKVFKDSKSVVVWALENPQEREICIAHVHVPAQTMPLFGADVPITELREADVKIYHEKERNEMLKVLDKYVQLCTQRGLQAHKLYIEADSVVDGILTMISQYKIDRLVMGAATDGRFSRKMVEPKSKKANQVRIQAPDFCHIQFVCKGRLIYTRQGIKLQNPEGETGHFKSPRSKFMVQNDHTDVDRGKHQLSASLGGWSTPRTNSEFEGSLDGLDRRSRSMSESAGPSSPALGMSERENDLQLVTYRDGVATHLDSSSPPSVLQERNIKEEFYDKLEQAMAEAERLRREAFAEYKKRTKAEKDCIEAINKAKGAECLYTKELKKRKEIEGKLAKVKEELETLSSQQDEVAEELQLAREVKSSLENQLEKSNQMAQALQDKLLSAVNLLQEYKKERDELQIDRDSAMCQAEELRKQLSDPDTSGTNIAKFYAEFSYSEIMNVTDNFNTSMKIGRGGYGNIYRACLRYTTVAIKVLNPDGMQGTQEFHQEVDVLSTVRHPNIVTLIGICKEAYALIYEYLPNGSLEDRLNCKDNTPPLSWQNRIQIATELCSVLIFLHSNNPQIIIHGDLKPANILLDAQLSCKLSDFGICRGISNGEMSVETATRFYRTAPKGTFAYIDPEFLSSGELSAKSDIYSYGIILLRLLTGKEALGIAKDVKRAVDDDKLDAVLDPSAGDWPFVQAKQLTLLALRCCEMSRSKRPDLVADVWRVLEPMRVSCRSSLSGQPSGSFVLGDDFSHPPSYFVCPIFQEMMQDPQIASDGFTYEAEAIRGWLDCGNQTSPMTNQKLPNNNLIPNRALRSAIQEWLQQKRKA